MTSVQVAVSITRNLCPRSKKNRTVTVLPFDAHFKKMSKRTRSSRRISPVGLMGALQAGAALNNMLAAYNPRQAPVYGPNLPRYRRRAASGVLQSNTGGRSLTRSKNKKRKRKAKRINVVKEIKKIKKEKAIEKNTNTATYQRKTVSSFKIDHNTNQKGSYQVGLNRKTDMDTLLDAVKLFDVGTGMTTGNLNTRAANMTVRVYGRHKFYLKNNDAFPVNIQIYDVVCIDELAPSVLTTWTSMLDNQPTGHLSTTDLQGDVRFEYSDNKIMDEYWKIAKSYKVYLKPGDEFTFYVTDSSYYQPNKDDTTSISYIKNFSHNVWFRTYGVPCHDSVTASQVALTPCDQIDVIQWSTLQCSVPNMGGSDTFRAAGASLTQGDLPTLSNGPIVYGVDIAQEVA
jgi:hypothetical protein